MKKKIKKVIVSSAIMALLVNGIAYARNNEIYSDFKNTSVSSELLSEEIKRSNDIIQGNAVSHNL